MIVLSDGDGEYAFTIPKLDVTQLPLEQRTPSLQTMNQQNKLALWAGRISECRNSGQNVRVWCKENGICEQTYYRWQKRLLEMARAQQEVQFAEVTPAQSVRSGNVAVTVRIAGVEADICNGADAATIETVLRILKLC